MLTLKQSSKNSLMLGERIVSYCLAGPQVQGSLTCFGGRLFSFSLGSLLRGRLREPVSPCFVKITQVCMTDRFPRSNASFRHGLGSFAAGIPRNLSWLPSMAAA